MDHQHVHDGVVFIDRADSDAGAAGSAGAGDDLAGEHHAHERVDHRVRPPDVVETESRATKTDFCEEISSSAVLSLADFRISSADMNLGGGGSSSRDFYKEQKAIRGISPSDSTAPEHAGPACTAAVTAGGAAASATTSTSTSTADPRPGDNTNRDNPAKASPTTATTPTPTTPTTPEIDGCRFVHLALDGDTAEFVRTCEQAFERRCGFDRVALDVLRSFLRSFMSNTDVNGLLGTGKMWLLSTAQMREMMGFDDEDHGGSECEDEGGWRVVGPAENQAAGPGSSGRERGETVLGQVPVARADGRGDDEAGACAASGCSASSAVHREDERSAASDAEAGEGLDSRRNNWNDNKGNENYSEAEASTTVSSSRSSSSRTRPRPEGEPSRSAAGRAALPTPPTGAVLDVGAGCGYITQQMRLFFRQVAATEVSTKMAARLRSTKTADLVFLADSLSKHAELNAWLSGLLLEKENDEHKSCGSNSRDGARAPLLLREHTPAHTLAPHELHEGPVPSHRKKVTPSSSSPRPAPEDRRQRLRLITCFNVLDRCQQPLTLLREMRKLCVEHGCRLLLSAVFPFEQWIEGHIGCSKGNAGGSSHGTTTTTAAPNKPKFERIAYRGQAHARSFEEQAAGFARHVLVRTLGFKLVKFARAPYISAGSAQAPLYVLSNGVFLLEPCEQSFEAHKDKWGNHSRNL